MENNRQSAASKSFLCPVSPFSKAYSPVELHMMMTVISRLQASEIQDNDNSQDNVTSTTVDEIPDLELGEAIGGAAAPREEGEDLDSIPDLELCEALDMATEQEDDLDEMPELVFGEDIAGDESSELEDLEEIPELELGDVIAEDEDTDLPPEQEDDLDDLPELELEEVIDEAEDDMDDLPDLVLEEPVGKDEDVNVPHELIYAAVEVQMTSNDQFTIALDDDQLLGDGESQASSEGDDFDDMPELERDGDNEDTNVQEDDLADLPELEFEKSNCQDEDKDTHTGNDVEASSEDNYSEDMPELEREVEVPCFTPHVNDAGPEGFETEDGDDDMPELEYVPNTTCSTANGSDIDIAMEELFMPEQSKPADEDDDMPELEYVPNTTSATASGSDLDITEEDVEIVQHEDFEVASDSAKKEVGQEVKTKSERKVSWFEAFCRFFYLA